MILIAGFGSIGAFLYFLLKHQGYDVKIFSNRQNINPFSIIFLNKNKNLFSFKINEVEKIDIPYKTQDIKYLFLTSKAVNSKDYLLKLLNYFEIKNLVLVQNGIGLEKEIEQFFKGNIYYLTFTTGLEFNNNNLIIHNYSKSQMILSFYGNNQDSKLLEFDLELETKFCKLGFCFDHWSVRFSKLILNVILNIVPAAFGGIAWEIFPANPHAINLERQLVNEIVNFMNSRKIKLFNFRGYNTNLIANFYRYCPNSLFKSLYSNPKLLRKIRDNRIPSFYKDLFVEKRKTEIEYYLGWYKNFKDFNFVIIPQIYKKIKDMENSILSIGSSSTG